MADEPNTNAPAESEGPFNGTLDEILAKVNKDITKGQRESLTGKIKALVLKRNEHKTAAALVDEEIAKLFSDFKKGILA